MFLKSPIRSDAQSQEGLKIVYDDVAPYAKENSHPMVEGNGLVPGSGLVPHAGLLPGGPAPADEMEGLKRNDVVYPGFALCFPGFSLLSGEYKNFPDNPQEYGYISAQISDESRIIDNPKIIVSFNQKFTSVGILLTFNTLSGDYADRLNIKWYSEDNLLSDIDFEPTGTTYFCSNYVRYYNKLVITFHRTSKPYRPVFLTRIDYGIYRDFFADEISGISCLQEINGISENISINTMSFTVRTKSLIPFDLQKKQKLSLYFNGALIGNFYLKNGAKKAKADYQMECHDAVGVLDGNEFPGGVYTGQTVADVLAQIFDGEDISYLIEEGIKGKELHGCIPYGTKRNALVQIAFAVGAIVDTSNYDGVIIYPQSSTTEGAFNDQDTFDGVTLERGDIVTGIRLTVHAYQKIEDEEELYKDTLNSTAEIIFSDPHHSLTVTGGEIIRSGDNYAVISGSGGEVVLTGKIYSHVTSNVLKESPDIMFNKNIKDVSGATLIHSGNAQEVLNRVYDYYQHNQKISGSVLLKDRVIGQKVDIDTGYDGIHTGVLESINYNFSREIMAEVTIHE